MIDYTGSTFVMSRVGVKGNLPVYVWQQQPKVHCEKYIHVSLKSVTFPKMEACHPKGHIICVCFFYFSCDYCKFFFKNFH